MTTTTNIKPLRSKGTCDCAHCRSIAKRASKNVRKKFKRLTNKRIRKMDFDSPSYSHSAVLA